MLSCERGVVPASKTHETRDELTLRDVSAGGSRPGRAEALQQTGLFLASQRSATDGIHQLELSTAHDLRNPAAPAVEDRRAGRDPLASARARAPRFLEFRNQCATQSAKR